MDESESGQMVLEKVSRIHLHIRGVDVKLETVENRQTDNELEEDLASLV